jgi:hypothetical protein
MKALGSIFVFPPIIEKIPGVVFGGIQWYKKAGKKAETP